MLGTLGGAVLFQGGCGAEGYVQDGALVACVSHRTRTRTVEQTICSAFEAPLVRRHQARHAVLGGAVPAARSGRP